MKKPKVIVTRQWPDRVERRLQDNFDAQFNATDHAMSTSELKDAFARADAVFTTVTDRVTEDMVSQANRRAQLIGNFGVGFNNIDTDAAKANGVVVTNTPDVLTDATAELAMTLLLCLARRVGEGERHVRAEAWTGWRPTHMLGTQVTGKTLGLIGVGRIGRAMAMRAHFGFQMRIVFYDPFPVDADFIAQINAESRDDIAEVLREADFVSLHCPATPENHHLIDASRLAQMKRDAFLINTARGDIVDETALIDALQSNQLAGAGLDVFEREPQIPRDLLDRDDVVLLPHLGSATVETRVAMGFRVIDNALAFFSGQPPPDRVV
jgi:lactate dehydrogenase-like 2-hydroxyacid dehydrogenase